MRSSRYDRDREERKVHGRDHYVDRIRRPDERHDDRDRYHEHDRSSRSNDRHDESRRRSSSHRKEERRKVKVNHLGYGYTENDLDGVENNANNEEKELDNKPLEKDRTVRDQEEDGRTIRQYDRSKNSDQIPSTSSSKNDRRSDVDGDDEQGRRRRRHKSSDEEKVQGLFDWTYHKPELDRLFFKDDEAVIRK